MQKREKEDELKAEGVEDAEYKRNRFEELKRKDLKIDIIPYIQKIKKMNLEEHRDWSRGGRKRHSKFFFLIRYFLQTAKWKLSASAILVPSI